MPRLLQGTSPLQYEFVVSLPHSLLATASLVCAAPQFEGLADALWELRGRVPADLLAEIGLLLTFPGGYQRFTSEIMGHLPAGAAEMGFEALAAHLEAIPAVHYQLMALRALSRRVTPRPSTAELVDLIERPAEWSDYLARVESQAPPEAVAELVRDGAALKRRLLAAMQRFWRAVYAQEYEVTRPQMERSVEHHRARPYTANFGDLFVTVTGRLVPEPIAQLLPGVSSVTLVPSCYVGPYVAYSDQGERLVIFYNCRATLAAQAGPLPGAGETPAYTLLYPPLKALADETRLQILSLLRGREMYAQEIVDQLGISQPAVSRHLNLMAAAGVLRTRREGNLKFYAIDGEAVGHLADAVRSLR